ncbi:DUF1294 domain-containing protein [Alkaliphilus sp. MSJ-5]|uniref:DUF1294 domain-containing protein n=1 Tax=Alkaliphilus flagellatus TaxID=2841507 RepID=A0ABS6FZF6_9FIRM|nr:DUF1294 domain-containing protein [Alkaliphilus flagellatus]MBU5675453.1 DUF1294 domain-containing protein [Alkaliphilus flagellatus]
MINQLLLSYSRGEQIFGIYILLISLVGFVLMGIDKYKASKEKWRIQEFTLMTISFIGGAAGIMIGMIIFKHKINKKKFSIGVPLMYIFNLIVNRVIIYYL